MNFKTTFVLAAALAGSVCAQAQSPAEQLQKGIFAQESRGNLDAAIDTFRQLANSSLTPRDIAAQAQYRLTQALIAKGELSAATREMERLEKDFPEQRQLIGSLAAGRGVHTIAPSGREQIANNTAMAALRSANFEGGAEITIRGRVTQVNWVNPVSYVALDGGSQKYVLALAAPNQLYQSGFNRDTLVLNDEVTVVARMPAGGRLNQDGVEGVQAMRITHALRGDIFDRAKLPATTLPPPMVVQPKE